MQGHCDKMFIALKILFKRRKEILTVHIGDLENQVNEGDFF